jgi:hypothetical protein
MLGGGTHGLDCDSTTWRVTCRECGTRVHFFQCSHGSRVLFDELGAPWPIHDCDRSWGRTLHRDVDAAGHVTVEVAPGVTVSRAPRRFSIDPVVVERGSPTTERQ